MNPIVSYLPNAPIIPNINPTNKPIELIPPLAQIPNYLENIPIITILDNKKVRLDALLTKIDPSALSYKNYLAGLSIIPQYPSTLDLRNNLGRARDQGQLGSCVAFATVVIKEWQAAIELGYKVDLSPAFIYVHRNNLPGKGMSSGNGCDILANKGVCTEDSFNYSNLSFSPDPNRVSPSNIPSFAIEEANKYRTSNWVFIHTIDELKTALFLNGPCTISVLIYFPCKQRMWVPPNPDNLLEGAAGGHCMAIVGYNSNGFIIRNSWSAGWNPTNTPGMDGYDYFPEEDFKYLNPYGVILTATDLMLPVPPDPSPDPSSPSDNPVNYGLIIPLIIVSIGILTIGIMKH